MNKNMTTETTKTTKTRKILSLDNLTWTHLVNPSQKELDEITKKYDFHEIIEQDMMEFNTQDKIDVYDDYIFLVLHFPKYNELAKRHYSNEFNFVLGKDFLISLAKHSTHTTQTIREQYLGDMNEIDDEEEKKFRNSPYYILYRIIDAMYDKTILGLTKFNHDLTDIQEAIFEGNIMEKSLLEDLMMKSRSVIILKDMFSPQEEILEELNKATIKLHEGDLDVYFEDLQYKADKINNTITTLDDNSESLSNKYNTLVTLKTNSVISFLTIVTVIIGILTLITGFYGMNVRLPGQDLALISYGILIGMGGVTLVVLWIFKKKGVL